MQRGRLEAEHKQVHRMIDHVNTLQHELSVTQNRYLLIIGILCVVIAFMGYLIQECRNPAPLFETLNYKTFGIRDEQ